MLRAVASLGFHPRSTATVGCWLCGLAVTWSSPSARWGCWESGLTQIARISGAITVPDVIRDRFGSVTFGLLATLLIVFFMSFNLVAQFKAGCLILQTLLDGVGSYESAGEWMAQSTAGIGFLQGVSGEYLVCLLAFGIAVIIYTTYGGFHAVVWTDVMQGIVMVCGVMVLLPMALSQVGGLENATKRMARMEPPAFGYCAIEAQVPVSTGTWLLHEGDLLRVTGPALSSEMVQTFRDDETVGLRILDCPPDTHHAGIED